jgi:peptide deformylase
MKLKLRYVNDKSLREVCRPVQQEDVEQIKLYLPEMIKIMNGSGGVALAANQVGLDHRFFIMLVDNEVELFINPELLQLSDLKSFDEGCLSIPGVSRKNQRFHGVIVKYLDSNFKEQTREFLGINAVAVQHEIDHLNGKLYIDELSQSEKLLLLYKHKQFLNKKGNKR